MSHSGSFPERTPRRRLRPRRSTRIQVGRRWGPEREPAGRIWWFPLGQKLPTKVEELELDYLIYQHLSTGCLKTLLEGAGRYPGRVLVQVAIHLSWYSRTSGGPQVRRTTHPEPPNIWAHISLGLGRVKPRTPPESQPLPRAGPYPQVVGPPPGTPPIFEDGGRPGAHVWV